MKIKITLFILVALFISACGTAATTDKFDAKLVIKEYVDALKEKNLEKIKATASTKTVKLFEDAAKAQNISLEEMIKKNEPQIQPMLATPEIRDEKVEGDKATVEIKNPADGKWNKLIFVKEDGKWKIGAGEMLEDVKKEIDKMQKEQEPAKDDSDKSDKKEDSEKDKKEDKKEDSEKKEESEKK